MGNCNCVCGRGLVDYSAPHPIEVWDVFLSAEIETYDSSASIYHCIEVYEGEYVEVSSNVFRVYDKKGAPRWVSPKLGYASRRA